MNTHPSRDNRHIISLTTTLSIPHRGGWESGKLGDCRSTLLTALSLSKGEIGGIRRLARLGPVAECRFQPATARLMAVPGNADCRMHRARRA